MPVFISFFNYAHIIQSEEVSIDLTAEDTFNQANIIINKFLRLKRLLRERVKRLTHENERINEGNCNQK